MPCLYVNLEREKFYLVATTQKYSCLVFWNQRFGFFVYVVEIDFSLGV